MYEAQDTALCKYVGKQLKVNVPFFDKLVDTDSELDLHSVSLLPQDCLSIGYFLASIAVSYKGKFTVYLHSCSLGDAGIKILTQSLCRSLDPHSEITGHLDMYIGSNEITGEGASYIAEALRTTRAMWKLYLRGNPISDNGLQYITEAMTANLSLIELDLSGCSLRITEENGPTLTQMLQRNKTLRKLDLSDNKAILDNQASFIIEGLKKNTTLKKLLLCRCSIICLLQTSSLTCKIFQ